MSVRYQGKRVIELAVAIVIVSVMCVSGYREYSIRTRVSDAVEALERCKPHIMVAYAVVSVEGLAIPNAWGCEFFDNAAAPHISRITTDENGIVTAHLRNISGAMDGLVITLAPLSDPRVVATYHPGVARPLYGWRCGDPEDGTNIPIALLPSNCRGELD